jgi:hypothetical protein
VRQRIAMRRFALDQQDRQRCHGCSLPRWRTPCGARGT